MLKLPKDRPFYILGHRGAIYPDGFPYQNSLAAFREAITYADGIETDACRSNDNEIFFIHEAKYYRPLVGAEYCAFEHLDVLSKKSYLHKKIEETSSTELEKVRLKDGSRIPRFDETIELFKENPTKILDIELKGYHVADPLLPRLKESFASKKINPEQVVISSFNHDALISVRSELPTLTVGAIFCSPHMPPTPLYPWHAEDSSLYLPLTREALNSSAVKQINPDLIIIPEEVLRADTLALISELYPNAQIFAWVFTETTQVKDSALIKKIMELAHSHTLTGVMVDTPRSFVKTLEQTKPDR